jgi:hypothetical protein
LLIYLDTNIWNYLARETVDRRQLVGVLASKNTSLVLSNHTVYELARTFAGENPGSHALGVQLFSSIQEFLDLGVVVSKEVMEFLKEECYAFEKGLLEIDSMLDAEDREIVKREVEKLASGLVERVVREFIEKRTQFASSTRASQRNHVKARKELRRALKAVPESKLADWLQEEMLTPSGPELLYSHLRRMLGPGPTPDYARGVLTSAAGRAARGLVSADLYSNWRSASRGSNPGDLIDDMLHVLQAIYCDVYATAEPDQGKYARLLLTPGTSVAIYDQKTPIGQWLESL